MMNRHLAIVVCVGVALLATSSVDARRVQQRQSRIAGAKMSLRSKSTRLASLSKRVRAKKQLSCNPMSRFAPKRAPRMTRVQKRAYTRVRTRIARVRPISKTTFQRRSQKVLAKLKSADQSSAKKLLASKSVQRSAAAQHAVLALLQLKASKGGKALPISITALKSMVGSKAWSSRRVGNLALVLRMARIIAKREGISAKKAFDKALRVNGIYKKFYSGACS